MKQSILLLVIGGITLVKLQAQTISGSVLDLYTEEPLIGATIVEKGTTNGTITNFDGLFSLNLNKMPSSIVISYLGYETQTVDLTPSSPTELSSILLVPSAFGLDEVVITGVMDIVVDRQTPVATSTINAGEIQRKIAGDAEFPEVARTTPSIYISNQSSGYGEAEVWTRGFDQTNTAFLLNGQPINGMEDGRIYWSNWAGLTDVASAIQIQRGLGASKLAISSVGGTWNFIMKATETLRGGSISSTVGSDNYYKVSAAYNTGIMNEKWGISALVSVWSGNGWGHGTRGNGQTYFFAAGYRPAHRHSIHFLVTGAPQKHDQKYMSSIASHFRKDAQLDPRYNSNWGIYDGRYFSERTNYYHKPIINVNWDWDINNRSSLSTVLYGSLGRGGGTGGEGGPLARTQSGQIDFDATVANPASNYLLRTSVNNHNWIGAVLKYENELSRNWHLSLGTDLRRFYGDHFRQVYKLLDQPGYYQWGIPAYPDGYTASTSYKADPWSAIFNFAPRGDRITYNSAETIRYAGGFGQLEFWKKELSAYLQGAYSIQDHVRHELFYAPPSDTDSEKVINEGYNAKIGLSYVVGKNHTFFGNAGIYSRQPFHDVVFENNSNTISQNAFNEDIVGLELGYKLISPKVTTNINVYQTSWNNRVLYNLLEVQTDGTVRLTDDRVYTAQGMDPYELLFQDQLHKGLEVDLSYHMNDHFRLKGMASLGNWEIVGEKEVELYDGTSLLEKVDAYSISARNIKVGGAPQTSWGMGIQWDMMKNVSVEANYLHYDRLYSDNGGIELPSYGLLDLNLQITIPQTQGQAIHIIGNVYNLMDHLYISKAASSIGASSDDRSNWKGIHTDNIVMFGKTRTANLTLRYSF